MDGYEYTDAEAYEREQYEIAAYHTALDEQEEYETRTVTAFCDCCEHEAVGTRKQLERNGWVFNRGGQFCEYHRY